MPRSSLDASVSVRSMTLPSFERFGLEVQSKRPEYFGERPVFQKIFQIVIVVFVVLLTAAALMLLLSGLISALMPLHTDSIVVVSGGVSIAVLSFIGLFALILIIAAIYLLARPRLR